MHIRQLSLAFLLPLLLTGCVGAVIGAGAETGESIAEERSVGTKVDDASVYADVTNRLIQSGHDLFMNVNVRVRAGRVMLTGTVASDDLARQAVASAWKAKSVKEVINDLTVTADPGFIDTANDALIQKNLESRLLFTKDVWLINYSINVVNGNAYILGRTYNRAELEHVLSVARTTKGVKKVVSHLVVKGEQPGETMPPSNGSNSNNAIDTAPPMPASTDGTIGTDSVSSTDLPPAK